GRRQPGRPGGGAGTRRHRLDAFPQRPGGDRVSRLVGDRARVRRQPPGGRHGRGRLPEAVCPLSPTERHKKNPENTTSLPLYKRIIAMGETCVRKSVNEPWIIEPSR